MLKKVVIFEISNLPSIPGVAIINAFFPIRPLITIFVNSAKLALSATDGDGLCVESASEL